MQKISINEVLEIVKKWIEEETGPGFSYHIGHCDDLTYYYEILRKMLNEVIEK